MAEDRIEREASKAPCTTPMCCTTEVSVEHATTDGSGPAKAPTAADNRHVLRSGLRSGLRSSLLDTQILERERGKQEREAAHEGNE